MAHFKSNHAQFSFVSSKRYYQLYFCRNLQVVTNVNAIYRNNHQLKKSIHTTQSSKQRWDGDKGNTAEADDYELDLITLTRRKKQKKTEPESEVKSDDKVMNNEMDSSNVRFDDHLSKPNRTIPPYLHSENARADDDLVNLSSKDLERAELKKRIKEETAPNLSPLLERIETNKDSSSKNISFSKEEIDKFDQDLKENLTSKLNEEFDKTSFKKKSKVNNILNIVSGKNNKTKRGNGNIVQKDIAEINNDSKLDQALAKTKTDNFFRDALTTEDTLDYGSNAKLDNDLISKNVVDKNSLKSVENSKDTKSDDCLVPEDTGKVLESHEEKSRSSGSEDKTPKLGAEAHDDNARKAQGALEYLKHRDDLSTHNKSAAQTQTNQPKEDEVVNLHKPSAEVQEFTESPYGFGIRYNKEAPKIDELNEIVNVSRPFKPSKSETRRLKKRNKSMISELTQLSPHERIDKIDDIMRLLESEIPKLSKQKTLSETKINEKSDRIKTLRERLNNVSSAKPSKSFDNVDISLTDLEGFLEDAKKKQDIREEENFREERAYEYSKLVNDKNSKSFDKKNFFSPVDESLYKRIMKPFELKPSIETSSDELFFPRLQSKKHLSHEFMIWTNRKKIITDENPLGDDYYPQDLFTIFRNLGDPEKYLKQINKFEKHGGWKLIGSGGDTNKILIFERYVDKEQEKKDLRKQRFRRFAWSFTSVFMILYGFGSYFEHEQNSQSQYKVDEISGKIVKAK